VANDSVALARPVAGGRLSQTDIARSSDRLLLIVACALFATSFVTGGSSQETGAGAIVSQLLAIPVLLYALTLAVRRGRIQSAWPGVAVLALVVLVPLLQLLPVSHQVWELPALRLRLQQDLAAAGVTGLNYSWSLAPAATKRAVMSLLPASALFLSALAMNREALRGFLWLAIALSMLSLLLAIAQLGLPQDSILNPYPDYAPAMGGIFANRNHQADVLAVALVLCIAMAIDERRRIRRGVGSGTRIFVLSTLAVLFAVSLPLVGSRAGIVIAILATVAIVAGCGSIELERLRSSWRTRLIFLAALAFLGLGTYGALHWMQVDAVDAVYGTRGELAKQSLILGFGSAPLGSGVGSFVPLFEQESDISLLQNAYVNHAHNEYVQWWLEAGAFAIVCMIAAILALLHGLRRLAGLRSKSGLRISGTAAFVGIVAMLVHCWVDYPLRTPALLAMFGLLAGVFFSAAAQAATSSQGAPAVTSATRRTA
jgi:O-antigen ligase